MDEYEKRILNIESSEVDDAFKKAFAQQETFDFLDLMLASRSNFGKNRFTSHGANQVVEETDEIEKVEEDKTDEVAIDDDRNDSEDSDPIAENLISEMGSPDLLDVKDSPDLDEMLATRINVKDQAKVLLTVDSEWKVAGDATVVDFKDKEIDGEKFKEKEIEKTIEKSQESDDKKTEEREIDEEQKKPEEEVVPEDKIE